MPPGSRRNADVDRVMGEIDPAQRKVARALREVILEVGPELEEKVRYGVPWYRGKGYIVAIAAQSDHTNLEFHRGTSLRDPAHLLEGTGKNMRHVKDYSVDGARQPRLKALLREALEFDAS